MTKKELVRETAHSTGMTLKDTELALNGIIKIITDTLTAGDTVVLRGFGEFRCTQTSSEGVRYPSFSAGLTLRNSVAGPPEDIQEDDED